MEFDRLDFPAAVGLLAKNVGLEIPREEGSNANPEAKNTKIICSASLRAQHFYRKQLSGATEAANYLKSGV